MKHVDDSVNKLFVQHIVWELRTSLCWIFEDTFLVTVIECWRMVWSAEVSSEVTMGQPTQCVVANFPFCIEFTCDAFPQQIVRFGAVVSTLYVCGTAVIPLYTDNTPQWLPTVRECVCWVIFLMRIWQVALLSDQRSQRNDAEGSEKQWKWWWGDGVGWGVCSMRKWQVYWYNVDSVQEATSAPSVSRFIQVMKGFSTEQFINVANWQSALTSTRPLIFAHHA